MTEPAPAPRLRLLPFRGVHYSATRHPDAGDLVSPPYDVIDEAQRATLEAQHTHNIVRLVLPREGEGDAGGQPPARDRYANAARLFDDWLASGVLEVAAEPAIYVYQQRRGDAVLQRGLLGAVEWQPFDARVILPHENVRPGPVADRLALMRAMEANPEPIYLLHDAGPAVREISSAAAAGAPAVVASTPDGVRHEAWAIDAPDALESIAVELAPSQAMIADGHHRYTTYGYLRDELRAARGRGPWDRGLALLVDAGAAPPLIHPIHRAIPGLRFDDALERARPVFEVGTLDATSIASALDVLNGRSGHAFVVSDGERFALLCDPDPSRVAAAAPGEHTAAWWELDASVAAVLVMEQLWNVSDAAGEVEAEHDPVAALRLARETGGVALLLKPPPLPAIQAVADAGDAMPRKSTLFMPKPCSGLLMRAFRFEN
jgi:uncharacterized protein (DUF1015 family)